MQTLHLTGIESKSTQTGNTKVILICQEGKFYFYRNTKNGNSKSFQQFNSLNLQLGQEFQAEVKSEEKTFTNSQGKSITYTDNWIQYFGGSLPNTPTTQNLPPRSDDAIQRIREWASTVETRLNALEKKVEAHGTLLTDLRGEPAVQLHESFAPESNPIVEKAKEILGDIPVV